MANKGWQRIAQQWTEPEDDGSTEQIIAAREAAKAAAEAAPLNVGQEPAHTGAWYLPPNSIEGNGDHDAAIETPVQEPLDLGYFDAARSGALQGIAPDLGQFDEMRSGVLPGITDKPYIGEFDEARSGSMPGIGSEEPFDPTQSGAVPGIQEAQSKFDPERSGEMEGLAAVNAPADPSQGIVGDDNDNKEDAIDDPAATLDEAADSTTAEAEANATTVEEGQAVAQAEQQQHPLQPDKFADVERNVDTLRQQYQEGKITRAQLQDELRRLMLLDDSGRWWMLGLETNRWYRYDGRQWVPDEPPRPVQQQSSAVPTETGVQSVVTGTSAVDVPGAQPAAEGAAASSNDDILLEKVPIFDSEATMVGRSATSFQNMQNPNNAPTQQNLAAVGSDPSQATVPTRTVDPAEARTLGGGNATPAVEGVKAKDELGPALKTMDGIQPNYSEAFSGYFDRASVRKWGFRAVVFGVALSLLGAFVGIIIMLAIYFFTVDDYTEQISNLDNLAGSFQTTTIIDASGNELANFNSEGARESIPLTQISPFVIHATLATEDPTFYQNPGFSIPAILRATYFNVLTQGGGGGASTITQQLARNLVLDAEFAAQRNAERKFIEIIVAAEIAREYDKNQILEFYLNEIYYGNQAYGIEAASQTYFNKSAIDLNFAEASFLAGLPQSPAIYDPVVNRETALLRMQDVMRLQTEANGNGCIQFEHETGLPNNELCITQESLETQYVLDIANVQTTLFEAPTFARTYPHFVNVVENELQELYGSQDFYGAGLRVFTTIVPEIQNAAQGAVTFEISDGRTPGANNGSVVAVRPSDGAILAFVGSEDFNDETIDGQVSVPFTPQQPGSSIKPLVYITALEGIAENDYWYPGTIIWDVPSDFNGYRPVNFSGNFSGPVSLRFALGQSLNIPAVKGLAYTTPQRFTAMLERLNFVLLGENPTQAGLQSALGGLDLRQIDMVRAYAAMATGGVMQDTYSIVRIENAQGDVIYEANQSPEGTRVFDEEHAFLISNVLSDESVKISSTLTVPGFTTAAKTGTSNDNRDVWTIGYTPDIAVAVWVGRTDNQPMSSTVFGSNTAAPIWNTTMQAGISALGLTNRGFGRPSNIVDVTVCSYTGAVYAAESCPGGSPVNEIARATQQPPNESFLVTIPIDTFTGLRANQFCSDYTETRTFVNLDDLTAIAWLNNNPNGQAWAQQRGIQLPVQEPPTGECVQGQQRPQAVVATPAPGQEVGGLTQITGTVTAPNFASYEFRLAPSSNPEAFGEPLSTFNSQQPQQNTFIGSVDFTNVANGSYILRLSVISTEGGRANVDVPVFVNNVVVTPVPTQEVPPPPTQETVVPPQDTTTDTQTDTTTDTQTDTTTDTQTDTTTDTQTDDGFVPLPPTEESSGQ